MNIALIAAAANNRAIGRKGQIPWKLPDDFAYFRSITVGHHIIMGRKTLESIGHPLPVRVNVVITRNREFPNRGYTVVHSLEEALEYCRPANDPEIMVIGGAQIYEQTLQLANRIYLTRVHTTVENADAFFPKLDQEWIEVSRIHHPSDEKHKHPFDWVVLEKRE